MSVHTIMFNELRIDTYLLQFYGWLTRGLFSDEDKKKMDDLINKNIDRLHLMQNPIIWDGRYDLNAEQHFETQRYVNSAKEKLNYVQICDDEAICTYIKEHPDYALNGIVLNDLKHLLDITPAIKRGHLLHDIFHGYPAQYYLFQVDCMDYLHSAAHFYNEAYDYYYKRKTIKNYSEIDINTVHWTEQKRIQPSDEVSFRNFRESYINLIFFVESFINSVGYHGYLSGISKNETEENQLRGVESVGKKGYKNYSNLKQRISNITRILGGQAIDCTAEPFNSYLQNSVELRNQYVHSSIDKPKIKYTLHDWKQKCDQMIDDDCMNLLRKFWKSCYPHENFPVTIANTFEGNSFKGRPGKYYADPS